MPKRKRPQKSTSHVVKKTSEEYASSSTAHGFSYISEPERLAIERCFWVSLVITTLLLR